MIMDSTHTSTVDVAEHNGDIRIYEIANVENWIQSDTSVEDVLDENDSHPVAGVVNELDTAVDTDDGVDTAGDDDGT